jgi:hypothetical protein
MADVSRGVAGYGQRRIVSESEVALAITEPTLDGNREQRCAEAGGGAADDGGFGTAPRDA